MSYRSQLAMGLICSVLTGCIAIADRTQHRTIPGRERAAPYPYSTLIERIEWQLPPQANFALAYGSDLWPSTWGVDGDLYGAWGDGGGFDGAGSHEDVETNKGRVSLGIARIKGVPSMIDSTAVSGHNVWGAGDVLDCGADGQRACAEYQATFGGKISSLLSVSGVLYAIGGFWTSANCDSGCNPVQMGGAGPLRALAWSVDGSRTWRIAPWAGREPFGGSFLNFGRDNSGALDGFVYVYYTRTTPDTKIYLKRVPRDELMSDPASSAAYTYLSGVDRDGNPLGWSSTESDAAPIFTDPNFVSGPCVVYDEPIGRFLLTVGHNRDAPSDDDGWSAGRVGLFEAPNPWGPWATVGYYDDWGRLGKTAGDYLDLNVPSKWISADGKTLWAVFSGVGPITEAGNTHLLDSFNLARGTLILSRAIPTIQTPKADTPLRPGGQVTVQGTGRALRWSAIFSPDSSPPTADKPSFASGTGRSFTFAVPTDLSSNGTIRLRLSSSSGASVYRDYVVSLGQYQQ